ncbi:hypothetical protein HYE67_002785 [Fusarium culmorum]|uniref:Transmembrane protein n=1 Tax=Fusarium culmorum TaxID=5516 RepID=A0A7S8D222_FUSCU|nr:hypothetical protein HYE67_002785 [Fusarium culmorum]
MLPFHYFIFTLLTIVGLSFSLPTQTLEAQPAPTLSHALPDTTSMPDSLEERQERNNANPSVFNPPVTAAPDQAEKLESMGWRQTTYYECRTRGGQERCGWHIPVYKAAAEGRRGEIVGWKVVVGIALGLAMLLYGGWCVLSKEGESVAFNPPRRVQIAPASASKSLYPMPKPTPTTRMDRSKWTHPHDHRMHAAADIAAAAPQPARGYTQAKP